MVRDGPHLREMLACVVTSNCHIVNFAGVKASQFLGNFDVINFHVYHRITRSICFKQRTLMGEAPASSPSILTLPSPTGATPESIEESG
jgi:hypothetical protein